MSAYMIGQIQITDPEEYQKYLAGFYPIFERHGGRVVGQDPEAEVIEGTWAYPRTIIMRFPSREAAHAWHADPDYQTLAQHRYRSAKVNLVLVDGKD